MKDKDLDIFLAEYRSQVPTSLQTQKWKRAVHQELHVHSKSRNVFWMQLIAASVIGFLVGALVFKTSKPDNIKSDTIFQNVAQIDESNTENNATIEYVFVNTN